MDRKALSALRALREQQRFIRGMVSWIGFRQTPIYYDRLARAAGETKYPVKKSLLLAIDAFTSFSMVPLRIASLLGVMISALSILYIFVVMVKQALGMNLPGYTSLMAAILFLGGVQLIVLGIMGEYIGRIYEQGKNRPIYLIDEVRDERSIHRSVKLMNL